MLKACPLLGGVQGCIAPPKFPNLQKVPQIAVCEQRKSEKLGFYVFLAKEMATNSGKGPLLSDLHPLR